MSSAIVFAINGIRYKQLGNCNKKKQVQEGMSIHSIKRQSEQMSDERNEFYYKWLSPETSHRSRDSDEFIQGFLNFVRSDKKLRYRFIKNIRCLLLSRQSNLDKIFQYCVGEKMKIYEKEICLFLKECLNEKSQIYISQQIQKYIIENIWKESMEKYLQKSGISSLQIMQYLSLKLRSLNHLTRNYALGSLEKIIEAIIIYRKKSPFFNFVIKILPQMIQKQNYGKEVCFYRGVLLQVLQDEHCYIKKKGIQLLGKAQACFETSMIRPLILYMLNDQHQAVRETCLIVLSQIPSLDLQKQDLRSLLVCLKENNTSMRNYTYQCLCLINITSSEDFKAIFERLFTTLFNRGEDKKRIYITCLKLGKKYPNYVLTNLQNIYKYNDTEQPNWKNLVYRARLIVVAAIGKQRWPKTLPKYFISHYLYIRDVLIYVFQNKTNNNQNNVELVDSEMVEEEIQSNRIGVHLSSDWQIYQYIQAMVYATQGFLKSVFEVILDWVKKTKLGKYSSLDITKSTLLQLQKLQVMYDIYVQELAKKLIGDLVKVINNNSFYEIRVILQNCMREKMWSKLQKIEGNIFKISNTDKTKIVISNREEILKRSFVEFSNSGLLSGGQDGSSGQVGYLRMSQVDFEEVNQKLCTYRVSFKCKQLRCLILYGHPPQYYVAHTSNEE